MDKVIKVYNIYLKYGKNQENFDETTKNVNAYDRKNSKHNSGYSETEP